MRAYHRQIVDNVVAYIAQQYYNAHEKDITQTLMFKILALFDFRCLRKNGRPCLEFSYTARDRGPVPEELYRKDLSEYSLFSVRDKKSRDYTTRHFIATDKADLDFLAPSEKQILVDLVSHIVENKLGGQEASTLSHREIKAWQIAYDRKKNSTMSYAEEFDDLDDKTESQMTLVELNFIKYKELMDV